MKYLSFSDVRMKGVLADINVGSQPPALSEDQVLANQLALLARQVERLKSDSGATRYVSARLLGWKCLWSLQPPCLSMATV